MNAIEEAEKIVAGVNLDQQLHLYRAAAEAAKIAGKNLGMKEIFLARIKTLVRMALNEELPIAVATQRLEEFLSTGVLSTGAPVPASSPVTTDEELEGQV